MKNLKIIAFACIPLFTMCKATQNTQTNNMDSAPSERYQEPTNSKPKKTAPAIVYKTRADYRNFVPVTMNKERNAIESYPAPTDVFYRGVLAKPTELINGYLLDNRGISAQAAFLDITYEEYSKLPSVDVDFLLQHIKDATPLLELYDCGSRSSFTNEVNDLNQVVRSGFKGCKSMGIFPSATFDPSGSK